MKKNKLARSNRPYRSFVLPMADSPRIESRLRAILAPSLRRIAASSRRERTVALIASATLALTLGAMHPVASRRNAAPSIAFAAEPSSPTHKEAVNKVPRLLIDTLPSNPRWTRSLPNNMGTVELVGISLRHDEKADLTGKPDPLTGYVMDEYDAKIVLSRSWKPDGLPYALPIYPVGLRFTHFGVPPKRLLEFALRFSSRGDDALQVSDDGFSCSGFLNTADSIPTDGFRAGDKIWRGDLVVPRSQRTFAARFLMTGGTYPWHQDFIIYPGMSGAGESHITGMGGEPTRVAIVGPFYDAKRQTGFTLTNSSMKSRDTRVVAIDRQGREVEAGDVTSTGGEGYTQTTIFFDPKILPLKQIAKIRFEARPYQTVDFGNVPLYPTKGVR